MRATPPIDSVAAVTFGRISGRTRCTRSGGREVDGKQEMGGARPHVALHVGVAIFAGDRIMTAADQVSIKYRANDSVDRATRMPPLEATGRGGRRRRSRKRLPLEISHA